MQELQSPLPARLRQARKAMKFTQKELGEKLGMEPGSASARMNQYEKGKHTPDYATLKRMAEELNVPVAYFFCETEAMAKLVKSMSNHSEEEINQLLEQFLS